VRHPAVRVTPRLTVPRRVQAIPGAGTGAYKIGANYAPALHPQKAAAQLGYVQNLWLHGPEHYLTEARISKSFAPPAS
jgi:branched-chain amino acid aminotransferase